MASEAGEQEEATVQKSHEGFTLRENLNIATITLFVAGGGFAVTARLLHEFVDSPVVNEIQTALYLTGLAFGALVLLIKLLVRVSR